MRKVIFAEKSILVDLQAKLSTKHASVSTVHASTMQNHHFVLDDLGLVLGEVMEKTWIFMVCVENSCFLNITRTLVGILGKLHQD